MPEATDPTRASNALLAAENVYYLEQGASLLERLTDGLYTRHPPIAMSPVGGHLRHCLEFYECFLDGLPLSRVDYDARIRDPAVETDRGRALAMLRRLAARLAEAVDAAQDRPLWVAMDRGAGEQGEAAWSRSTVKRELQFLRSHTVHHYALISAVVQLLGLEVPADFGVAPATLEHRRLLAETAASR